MIKVGSRVKFISDTGVGTVRSIKGNLAYVEVEDGFEIPALITDIVEVALEQENEAIVKIGPDEAKPSAQAPVVTDGSGKKQRISAVRGINNYGKVSLTDDYEDDEPIDFTRIRRQHAAEVAETQVDPTPPVPQKAPWEETDYLVKLLFVPVSDDKPAESADLDAWLVNDSSYTLFYTAARHEQRGNYVRTLASGTLSPDSKEKIRSYRRAELAEIQTLHFALLPHKPTAYVPRAVEAFDMELHPLKFVRPGNYAENDYFDLPAVEFTLASSEEEQNGRTPVRSEEPVQKTTSAAKPQGGKSAYKKSTSQEEVIDLHADEVLDSTEGLSPGEILSAQLARFTIALEGALKAGNNGPRRMVFIHGVGKGKLRYEIEKILKREYPKLRYQDASFAEYGYGAIMVFLR